MNNKRHLTQVPLLFQTKTTLYALGRVFKKGFKNSKSNYWVVIRETHVSSPHHGTHLVHDTLNCNTVSM
jgi:hypothetical protein